MTDAKSLADRLAQAVADHLDTPERAPLVVDRSPDEIAAKVRQKFSFQQPKARSEVFEDARSLLDEEGEHANHPGYFGLFRPGTDEASVYADALVALYDPNLAVRRFAPAAAELERHVLKTVARCFGTAFERGIAHFTSGGQEANHTATVVALGSSFPEFGVNGLQSIRGRPLVYLSREAHHSFEKIAHACGLGRANLRWIDCARDLRMDVRALRRVMAADREGGDRPFLVVATAGTTSAGVIDPMEAIADVAGEHSAWFHVDAAWAGAAAMSPKLATHLAGIERADSITCDAHKWLSVPVGAGMFFCRHGDAVKSSFAVDTGYAPPTRGEWSGYSSSLQWSRRLMGLKLCFVFAELGLEGVAARLERMTKLGEFLREALRDADWQILNDTPFPLVCFTHPSLGGDRRQHAELARRVQDRGRSWISATTLAGTRPALRACVTNFRSSEEHVRRLVEDLAVARRMG